MIAVMSVVNIRGVGMNVYCVMEIEDYEYGCRRIESMWSTREQAQDHIEELGNKAITFWNGFKMDKYTINVYEVRGM